MVKGKDGFKRQSYKKLLKQSIDTSVPFNDELFKCEDKSVFVTQQFKSQLDVGRIVWKRPKELVDIPYFLFREKLGPSAQVEFLGKGLNQWFIAGCVAISRDKNFLHKIVPKDQVHFLHGILKFNFWRFGKWIRVVIDDKLPTFDNELIFSSSLCGPIFWVPLLEKAYAKFYGSYENMSNFGNLCNLLTDFTGGIVENITVNDDKMDQFRMIAEELDKKSLTFVTSKDNDLSQNPYNIVGNRIYIITNIKKPSSGTFRKTFLKDSSPGLIHLIDPIYDGNKGTQRSSYNEKLHEIWLPIDEFNKYFETITICRINIHEKLSYLTGKSNAQFCFDVSQDNDEIMIELMQKTTDKTISSLRFKIYKVEANRKYRIHNPSSSDNLYSSESLKNRSLFKKLKLSYGRYVLIPYCSNSETELFLRLCSHKAHNLKILNHDMPRKNIFPFLSPKYPKYVTQIIVNGANGLEKQDRFGSANPYCIIRYGRQAIKSSVVHDTLDPDWGNFSAIFYHGSFVNIIIEIWHHSLLIDSFIGQVEAIPKITDNVMTIQQVELCGRKKGHKRPGFVKYQIYTSEDLRAF